MYDLMDVEVSALDGYFKDEPEIYTGDVLRTFRGYLESVTSDGDVMFLNDGDRFGLCTSLLEAKGIQKMSAVIVVYEDASLIGGDAGEVEALYVGGELEIAYAIGKRDGELYRRVRYCTLSGMDVRELLTGYVGKWVEVQVSLSVRGYDLTW